MAHRANHRRLLDVGAVVDVFDADNAHEIDIAVMVVEGELHKALDGLQWFQLGQLQLTFCSPDVAVEFLEDFNVELFLATEIVIDHALRCFRALGDGVDPRTGQTQADKLDNGCLEDVLAGLFRVVFSALVPCFEGLRCTGIGEIRHSGLTTALESPDYGLSASRKEVSFRAWPGAQHLYGTWPSRPVAPPRWPRHSRHNHSCVAGSRRKSGRRTTPCRRGTARHPGHRG